MCLFTSAFVGVNHGSPSPNGNNTNQWKRIVDMFKEFGTETSMFNIHVLLKIYSNIFFFFSCSQISTYVPIYPAQVILNHTELYLVFV